MTDHEFITMRLRENGRQHHPSVAGGRLGRAIKQSGMNKLWLAAAAVALLGALLVGCGGNDEPPASGREAGSLSGAGAAGVLAGGTRLDDCAYANALVRSLERFTGAVPAFGTDGVAGKDAVIRSLEAFDGELAALTSELRGYRLNADVARVNDGVVGVFEDARKQLPPLKTAVERGDVAGLTAAATTLTGEVFPRLDAVQAENKATLDRLNRCARAHGHVDRATSSRRAAG